MYNARLLFSEYPYYLPLETGLNGPLECWLYWVRHLALDIIFLLV